MKKYLLKLIDGNTLTQEDTYNIMMGIIRFFLIFVASKT